MPWKSAQLRNQSSGQPTSTVGRAAEERAIKLATLKGASRDGQLVVVSRDLQRAVAVRRVAPTLQSALDDWALLAPGLAKIARELEQRTIKGAFDFSPALAAAPL